MATQKWFAAYMLRNTSLDRIVLYLTVLNDCFLNFTRLLMILSRSWKFVFSFVGRIKNFSGPSIHIFIQQHPKLDFAWNMQILCWKTTPRAKKLASVGQIRPASTTLPTSDLYCNFLRSRHFIFKRRKQNIRKSFDVSARPNIWRW